MSLSNAVRFWRGMYLPEHTNSKFRRSLGRRFLELMTSSLGPHRMRMEGQSEDRAWARELHLYKRWWSEPPSASLSDLERVCPTAFHLLPAPLPHSFFRPLSLDQRFSKCNPRPATCASPGSLSEMKVLGPVPENVIFQC